MSIRYCSWVNGLPLSLLLLLLAGIFLLVHLLYWMAGIAFDVSTLDWYWQFIDTELLKTRLLESLFYLHSQPPLYNLFLGLVLKAGGEVYPTLFLCLHLLMGFALYLALFHLLRLFTLSRALSLTLATLFLIQPAFVLYEMMLFYTLPQTLALTLAAVCLIRFWRGADLLTPTGLFLCLLALGGTWGAYHLACFLLVTASLVYLNRTRWRAILIGSALPLILLTAIYLKNYLLFGRFTASTWLGMNVWYLSAKNLSEETIAKMIQEGKVSELSRIGPFAPLSSYPPSWRETAGFEGIPILREERRSNGNPSFHHLAYTGISDQFLRDTIAMTRAYPASYLKGSLGAWFLYFRSASDFHGVERNRKRISAYNALFDRIVFLKTPEILAQGGRRYPVYLSLLIGLPLLTLYAIRLLFLKSPDKRALSEDLRVGLIFLCFHILFVALAGNALQSGENNRFRFTTDPFFLVILGLFLKNSFPGMLYARLLSSRDRLPTTGSSQDAR